jgi:hypothetical protein
MRYRIFTVALMALLLTTASLLAGGCTSTKGDKTNNHAGKDEGFAIYLTKDEIPPSQMEVLSHIEIADEPIVGSKDVIAYYAASHEIILTADAYQRIQDLNVPTSGRPFVVCVDRGAVYWGAFWVGYSSQSFDGVTIMKPLGVETMKTIKIELGYPGGFYNGEDPRDNATVMKALKDAGKLIGNF